ncbi:hypothetical protein V5799_021132 [Amblyomma americanum]|uniref:Uncharacterized protein n=1 Tax=Amblyomma americanum TaxID=6943 RepID=A0AAQ4FT62_AMBAM
MPLQAGMDCDPSTVRVAVSSCRPDQVYGITNEQPAVQRYVAVMKARGHDVEAFRSGYGRGHFMSMAGSFTGQATLRPVRYSFTWLS